MNHHADCEPINLVKDSGEIDWETCTCARARYVVLYGEPAGRWESTGCDPVSPEAGEQEPPRERSADVPQLTTPERLTSP